MSDPTNLDNEITVSEAAPTEPALEQLLIASREVYEHSYSPYSRFRVGAAVLAADGRTFRGTNVENASYGLTVCAERVAIFSAVSAGATRLVALAVSMGSPTQAASERMPCGACRQVMAEFMTAGAVILLGGEDTCRLADLLPRPFVLPSV